jgi:hypothetical protein
MNIVGLDSLVFGVDGVDGVDGCAPAGTNEHAKVRARRTRRSCFSSRAARSGLRQGAEIGK